MKKYKIYGIGAALVDTEMRVEDADLRRIGVEKGLMTLVDQERRADLLQALEGHLVEAHHASGGSVGNSIIAAASFGGPCFMSCRVANDSDGDLYVADMRSAGVNSASPVSADEGTGKCLVLVTPDAERSMNTYLGASAGLSTDQLDEDAITASEFVYIEGYLVTSPSGLEAAVKTREIAQANGVPVAVSFSDPGMVEHFPDQFREIVGEGVDLVFANEAEALQWTGTNSVAEAAEALGSTAKQFAITLGADGALCSDGANLHSVAGHEINAKDSNGAGDMFAGAFLYALTSGRSIETAGKFASLAAAQVVSQWGPRLKADQYGVLRDQFFGA